MPKNFFFALLCFNLFSGCLIRPEPTLDLSPNKNTRPVKEKGPSFILGTWLEENSSSTFFVDRKFNPETSEVSYTIQVDTLTLGAPKVAGAAVIIDLEFKDGQYQAQWTEKFAENTLSDDVNFTLTLERGQSDDEVKLTILSSRQDRPRAITKETYLRTKNTFGRDTFFPGHMISLNRYYLRVVTQSGTSDECHEDINRDFDWEAAVRGYKLNCIKKALRQRERPWKEDIEKLMKISIEQYDSEMLKMWVVNFGDELEPEQVKRLLMYSLLDKTLPTEMYFPNYPQRPFFPILERENLSQVLVSYLKSKLDFNNTLEDAAILVGALDRHNKEVIYEMYSDSSLRELLSLSTIGDTPNFFRLLVDFEEWGEDRWWLARKLIHEGVDLNLLNKDSTGGFISIAVIEADTELLQQMKEDGADFAKFEVDTKLNLISLVQKELTFWKSQEKDIELRSLKEEARIKRKVVTLQGNIDYLISIGLK